MSNTMLFDAHTHLNFEKYTEEERRELAAEIEASDVAFIIDVADCTDSAVQALKDADDYPWCYAAVGIHPDHASKYTDADIEEIRRLAAHPKAMAIGEIGLDFYYGTDDREEQQELFRKQIRLANELKMPIMIHSRDAHQLTMDILKEEGAFSDERKTWFTPRTVGGKEVPDARVQMHCFSGSPERLWACRMRQAMVRFLASAAGTSKASAGAPPTSQTPRSCSVIIEVPPCAGILPLLLYCVL